MNKSQYTQAEVADAVRSLLRKMGFTSTPTISGGSPSMDGGNVRAHMRIDMALSHAEMKTLQRMAGL